MAKMAIKKNLKKLFTDFMTVIFLSKVMHFIQYLLQNYVLGRFLFLEAIKGCRALKFTHLPPRDKPDAFLGL